MVEEVQEAENTEVGGQVGTVAAVEVVKKPAAAVVEATDIADPYSLVFDQVVVVVVENKAPAEEQKEVDSERTGLAAGFEEVDFVGRQMEEEH